ncbi:hypothetical protein CS542_06680 [Pedobacter sp. IW39]|nr:hypothetical protein CS542_06680 [Pedobacter sp. IW39]
MIKFTISSSLVNAVVKCIRFLSNQAVQKLPKGFRLPIRCCNKLPPELAVPGNTSRLIIGYFSVPQ